MLIGQRIRHLREKKGLSQGDIEHSTGLLRCYISRVEHGHTVPSLETLERFASALGIPVYRLFYDGEERAETPNLTPRTSLEQMAEESSPSGAEARFLLKIRDFASKLVDSDRAFLLEFARKLAAR